MPINSGAERSSTSCAPWSEKNDPVRVPVGKQVHGGRDKERHDGAALAPDQEAHGHEQGR